MTVEAPAQTGPERGRMLVVLAGVVTSALTLLGVWWLDVHTSDFHIMGWYADYVIPAGAILVGLAAGSGYGIVSYLTGYRIRRGLLWSVLALFSPSRDPFSARAYLFLVASLRPIER